jgi:hypothetical protein
MFKIISLKNKNNSLQKPKMKKAVHTQSFNHFSTTLRNRM